MRSGFTSGRSVLRPIVNMGAPKSVRVERL